MDEIWKDIPGYEGIYQVSNYGVVKSLSRLVLNSNGRVTKDKIIKPFITNKGYLRCCLIKDFNGKKHSVHRLVAYAFIPNTHNKPQINHINENKKDNRVSNLEWVTNEENRKHSEYRFHKGKSLMKKVYQFYLDGTLIAIHESLRGLQKKGFTYGKVGKCCTGKAKTHKGFLWSYKSEIN